MGDGGSADSSKRDRVDARLPGFCRRLGDAGIPLTRATVILDTLHPVHEGRAFRWRADKQKTVEVVDYGRTNEGEAEENWRSSPFFYLLQFGEKAMRRPLAARDPADFPTTVLTWNVTRRPASRPR